MDLARPRTFSEELASAFSDLGPEDVVTLAAAGGQSITRAEVTRLHAGLSSALRTRAPEILLSEEVQLESWALSDADELGTWLSTLLLAALGSHAGQKTHGYLGAALGLRAGASVGNRLALSLGRPLRPRETPRPTSLTSGGEVALDAPQERLRIHRSWRQLYAGLNIPLLGDDAMPYGAIVVRPSAERGYLRVRRKNSQPYGQNMTWNPELHNFGRGLAQSALFSITENDRGLQIRTTPTDAMESRASSPKYGRLTALLDTFGLISGQDESIVGLGELHFRGLRLVGMTASSAIALAERDHAQMAANSVSTARDILERMNYDLSGVAIDPLPKSIVAATHAGCPNAQNDVGDHVDVGDIDGARRGRVVARLTRCARRI
ncbi:MAG: hypothetical protein AAFZ18_13350 [Myxococcota bacterium]